MDSIRRNILATGAAAAATAAAPLRCVERCLEGFPNELTAIWSIARGLTAPWGSDRNEDAVDSYKFKTAVKALSEIADLVENFAKRRFGTDDLSKISEAERFLLGPEQDDLNRRFPPYEG